MPSKQSDRRRFAKLRAEFYATPWAIDARALGALAACFEEGDLEAVGATLALGRREDDKPFQQMGDVAVIAVTGVLQDADSYMVRWGYASSYQLIEKAFNQALDDEQIKSIVFYFDTPGGSAIGCKRVADLVFENRGIKHVRGFVQTMCASAGYYIGAACDRLDATADSMVGSIGTIFPHQEFSGMLAEMGVKATVITNSESPKKGHGNIYEPLTDESRKTLEGFVESYGASFISDVARYKGVDRDDVASNYGRGDAMRADLAIRAGMVDAIVENHQETLLSLQSGNSQPVASGNSTRRNVMNERIKAQLFALGLIDSLDASDAECKAALAGFFGGRGQAAPSAEAEILAALQRQVRAEEDAGDEDGEEEDDTETEGNPGNKSRRRDVGAAHDREQGEARLADLRSAASLINEAAGYTAVTAEMVLDAHEQKLDARKAMKAWNEKIAANESPVPGQRIRITGEGADRYAADVVDAMVYRAGNQIELSDAAASHVRKPLWAIAGECLQMSGQHVDMYGDREAVAVAAMQMGVPGQRHTFFSSNENRQYISASGTPAARPGDFPNILSALANKYLDTIQLDDDYSFPLVSAVLPGGLSDFKPAMMANKGIVEELDELQDAEQFKQLGLAEEVLSYIFLRRFGNKWGWTPVMVANDDMNAFAEGMIGLEEAWQVTQNRLVIDRFTANETLLDGSALFANRADTGTGSNPATNHNIVTGGAAPSDTQWGLMETQYADIGGINTGRRVRGSLNVCFCPTGAVAQEARRTFLPLNAMGLEGKVANTTANVGLYRGEVQVIPESELRVNSSQIWYGLRNPTRLNTATVVRGYFNGYGTAGRRERWYDPENKTTWVSIEGRIAVAVKNWRYAIRNAGTGA